MILELTPQERDMLVEMIAREISDLGSEIHHTDSRDYREDLKARRKLLQDLLDRMSAVPVR